MVNPGRFHGSRLEFLVGAKAVYRDAVNGGHVKDAIADIQRRFFKRFPINLPLGEEPSPEHLASVNDDEPDPEILEPDKEKLSPAEYEAEMSKLEERTALVTIRKAQIKRWLAYQYGKDISKDTGPSGVNPYHRILCQITGTRAKPPRLSTAVNLWRISHRAEIEDETTRAAVGKDRKTNLASIRERVARSLFEKLDSDERKYWAAMAKEEHIAAVGQWKKESTEPPSANPADRQRAIQNLPSFIQPILDGICAITGWKATLIVGGPEPAHQGRLNVISVHSGVTKGDVKMNFGRAEHTRYQNQLLPIYGDFLKKCYSVDDCRASALLDDEELECLGDMQLGDSVTVSTFDSAPGESGDNSPSARNMPPFSQGPRLSPDPPSSGDVPITIISNRSLPSRLSTPAWSPPASPPALTPPHSPPGLGAMQLVDGVTVSTFDGNLSSVHVSASPPAPGESGDNSPSADNMPLFSQGPRLSPDPPSSGDITVTIISNRSLPSRPSTPPLMPPHSPPVELSPSSALIGLPSDQKQSNPIPTLDSTPTTVDQIPPKRGPDELVAADEEGQDVSSKRDTKRRRVENSVRNDAGASKKLSSTARPTRKSTASKTLPSTPSSPPADPWFSNYQQMFLKKDLGEEWRNLVLVWVTFEEQARNTGLKARVVPAAGRPQVVSMWIARKRSTAWEPDISNLREYADGFNGWWKYLQPDWRISNDRINKMSTQGDWDCLRSPGLNGIMSVVAGLFYWGLASQGKGPKGAHRKAWLAAVQDCHLVFSLL